MHDDDGVRGLADQVRWQWWSDAQRQGQSAIARRLAAHDEHSNASPVVRGGELLDALLQSGWQPPLPAITHPGELAALHPQAVVVDRQGQVWTRSADGDWCRSERHGISAEALSMRGPLAVRSIGDGTIAGPHPRPSR